MRYIVLFAAVMSLITTHARVRGADLPPKLRDVLAEPPVLRESSKIVKPAAKPALNIDPDHYCDRCGTYANVVKQEANGMHSHQCGKCGNEWWHSDPGAAPMQSYTLPSSSNCPNGNCPTSRTAPTRWRLFR